MLLVTPHRFGDDRGWFSETWSQSAFSEAGCETGFVQDNHAFSAHAGTVRGLHYQAPPYAQDKLVRCTRGAIIDIIVDLRPESPTFLEHISVELTEDNHRALYVPERFAHGYQVLRDDTETSYQVGEFYSPDDEGGLMYNDPRLGLEWPLPVQEMSEKDSKWQLLDEYEPELKRRMSL